MKAQLDVSVEPDATGWIMKPGGADNQPVVFRTQREAVAAARALARQRHARLTVHGRDGHVREERDYRADPESRTVADLHEFMRRQASTLRELAKR